MEETLQYVDMALDGEWVTAFMRPVDARALADAVESGDVHYEYEREGTALEVELPTADGPAGVPCWRYHLKLTFGGQTRAVEAFIPLSNR